MYAPSFTKQLELYSHAIADLRPTDPTVPQLVPRAARFALHELLAGRDEGMLDYIVVRFAGTVALAHTYHTIDTVTIEDYTLHIGGMPFPHASFRSSPHVIFSLSYGGQPMFDLREPTPATIPTVIA